MLRTTSYLLALLASSAMLGSAALAAPPAGIGVGVGAHGGIGVGAPPVGVPPVHVPPSTVPPVTVPKPQASALPAAHAKASAHVQSSTDADGLLHGTLTSLNGTSATVALSNGTTQTYTVSAQLAARLQSFVNKPIAFQVQNGALALVGAGTPPVRATLESLTGTTALMKLPNGSTQTYTVSAQQSAWLKAHVGKTVAFWTNANGTIQLNQSGHSAKTAHRSHPKKH